MISLSVYTIPDSSPHSLTAVLGASSTIFRPRNSGRASGAQSICPPIVASRLPWLFVLTWTIAVPRFSPGIHTLTCP